MFVQELPLNFTRHATILKHGGGLVLPAIFVSVSCLLWQDLNLEMGGESFGQDQELCGKEKG